MVAKMDWSRLPEKSSTRSEASASNRSKQLSRTIEPKTQRCDSGTDNMASLLTASTPGDLEIMVSTKCSTWGELLWRSRSISCRSFAITSRRSGSGFLLLWSGACSIFFMSVVS